MLDLLTPSERSIPEAKSAWAGPPSVRPVTPEGRRGHLARASEATPHDSAGDITLVRGQRQLDVSMFRCFDVLLFDLLLIVTIG